MTENEREVLIRLIESAPAGDRETARCQASHATVTDEHHGDNCGSLMVIVEGDECPRFAWARGVLAEASDLQSPPNEVILHVRDGWLWYLEVVNYVDVGKGFPPVDSLTYLGGQDHIR